MGMKLKSGLILIVAGIFSLLMAPSLASASQYREAVQATANEDYDRAMNLWQKLAKNGDPVASYNLAVFYREGYGTSTNNSKSRTYLKTATSQGLVEASTTINSGSIKPAAQHDVERVISQYKSEQLSPSLVLNEEPVISPDQLNDPKGWLLAQKPHYYTLQLASSQSEKHIRRAYAKIKGKGAYYKRDRKGKTWYFLIYGAYSNQDKATQEISQLPPEYQKSSPWVRQLRNIQRVVKN